MDRLIVFLGFDETQKEKINAANLDICGICRKALERELRRCGDANNNT